MTENDRVFDAFRNCITEPKCKDCPWTECDKLKNRRVEIPIDLALAVMRMLKAQEPRVMTVSEIGALANGDVVWVEFTDGRLLPMMVEDGCLMRWRYLWRICEDAFYDDDYKARCWTSRPDQATREATPWER